MYPPELGRIREAPDQNLGVASGALTRHLMPAPLTTHTAECSTDAANFTTGRKSCKYERYRGKENKTPARAAGVYVCTKPALLGRVGLGLVLIGLFLLLGFLLFGGLLFRLRLLLVLAGVLRHGVLGKHACRQTQGEGSCEQQCEKLLHSPKRSLWICLFLSFRTHCCFDAEQMSVPGRRNCRPVHLITKEENFWLVSKRFILGKLTAIDITDQAPYRIDSIRLRPLTSTKPAVKSGQIEDLATARS